jgi:dihydroorotate dehydrogenase electron transfer subunit
MSPPFVVNALITNYGEAAPNHFWMTFDAPAIAQAAQPGQFVQVRGLDWTDPLLPRPFSIMRARCEKGDVEILYRVVGKGTTLMSGWGMQIIQVVGPLGNPFRIAESGSHVLIGGGVGVPPMVMLAERLKSQVSNPKTEVMVLQGARTAEQLLCLEEFVRFGVDLRLATDDGSCGHHGLVTDLLKSEIRNLKSETTVYTCGPHAMMREVARLCREYDVPCQVALEAPMPCGFGVCMGCVVKTRDGRYRRVCREGPVFAANEVVWDE